MLAPPRVVPGRVETNATGTGFKMNPNPRATMRPGDETPGTYAVGSGKPVAGPTVPGYVTNTAGSTSGGAGGGGGATTSGPAAPTAPTMTNTAAANPDMEAALADYRARIEQQKAREGTVDPLLQEQVDNLRKRMSADQTQHATERAGSEIRDYAAGQRAAADERAARNGRPQGYQNSGIDEAAQRLQAKSASDIQLGQQQRLDNLTLGGNAIMSAPSQEALQREAGVTGLVGGEMGVAGAGAGLALQQQSLGLQQQQAQAQQALEQQRLQMQQQQQQQQMLMELLRSGGYY